MKNTRHYTVVEHPEGFNPWDNNPALIKLLAAVITSVTHAEPGAAARSPTTPTPGLAFVQPAVYARLAGK